MAYQPSLSDLSGDMSSQGGYRPSLGDLSNMPNSVQQTQSSPLSSIGSVASDFLRKILPTPKMPLGLNVASGALTSFMPQSPQKSILQASPQIASGENYGMPQQIASGIGSSMPAILGGGPNLLSQGLAGFGMGAAQAPLGQKLQSGAENALTSTLLGKVIPSVGRFAGNLLNPVTDKQIATNVQNVHDVISNQASKGFQDVGKGVSDRGISQVPLTLSTTNDLSNVIKSGYFPKTKQANNMIDNALTGDYNALRQMQSELWKKGTKAASSDSILDNNKADEIFDLRDRINNSISNHLKNTGHEDLNSLLDKSKAGYKYLQDTFYNKNISPLIKKLVNPDIREVPKNLGNLLQKDSIPMENVRNAMNRIPDNNWLGNRANTFPSDIKAYNFHKGIKPFMKGLGIGGFGLGEAAALYKMFQKKPHGESGGYNEDIGGSD